MRKLIGPFARFAVVGVLATLTHVAVFTVANEVLVLEPVLGNAVAFCVALVVGYTLNRRWTFAQHAEHGRIWRYFVAQLAGLAESSAIMYAVVHLGHLSPYLGVALSLALVPPVTFALSHWWVFRPR